MFMVTPLIYFNSFYITIDISLPHIISLIEVRQAMVLVIVAYWLHVDTLFANRW